MLKKIFFQFTLVTIVCILFLSQVFAYSYEGSGKWSSSTVKYAIATDVPSDHVTPIADAAKWWNDKTDITLSRDDSSDINVYVYDYGDVAWDGVSYMNPDWDSTFQYGNMQLNYYYTEGYSDFRIQLLAGHEFGHELGLAHVSDYVMMYEDGVYVAYTYNNDLENGPQQDDIDGINNRY